MKGKRLGQSSKKTFSIFIQRLPTVISILALLLSYLAYHSQFVSRFHELHGSIWAATGERGDQLDFVFIVTNKGTVRADVINITISVLNEDDIAFVRFGSRYQIDHHPIQPNTSVVISKSVSDKDKISYLKTRARSDKKIRVQFLAANIDGEQEIYEIDAGKISFKPNNQWLINVDFNAKLRLAE